MRLVIALLVVLAGVLAEQRAEACGGLFCNSTIPPGSPGPIRIVQDGERVLFAQTATGVTMIVEVRYDGQPTSFAWLLPIPGLPDGMDLEHALGVSSPEVFTTLQAATDPVFNVTVNAGALGNQCASASSGGFGCGDDASASKATLESNDGSGSIGDLPGENPYVTISDAARVGAYDAIHIEATNADALYTWLGQNGYFQDPAARPLLEGYIKDGWSFIGLKLQNGADTGDIKPVVLHLGEDAPCVPLRLTRIAANDGMPIFVWVLGAGRAIPKNYVNAVINDEAVSFPNGPDYLDALADAVDTASGHAWVTELASSSSNFSNLFVDAADVTLARETVGTLLASLPDMIKGPTLDRVLRAELTRPEGVTEQAWQESSPFNFDLSAVEPVHDVATLADRIQAEVVAPLDEVHDLIAGTTTLTRLFTVQDAAEMTKDPIFGFNATLPMVDRVHNVIAASGVDKNCAAIWEVTYPNGKTTRHDLGTVQTSGFRAVAGVSPLLRVEVLDEEGPAQPFDPAQAVDVDRALDGATLGIPSIPSGFELKPPKNPDAQRRLDPGGCNVSLPGAFLLLPLLFLFVRARRARA